MKQTKRRPSRRPARTRYSGPETAVFVFHFGAACAACACRFRLMLRKCSVHSHSPIRRCRVPAGRPGRGEQTFQYCTDIQGQTARGQRAGFPVVCKKLLPIGSFVCLSFSFAILCFVSFLVSVWGKVSHRQEMLKVFDSVQR